MISLILLYERAKTMIPRNCEKVAQSFLKYYDCGFKAMDFYPDVQYVVRVVQSYSKSMRLLRGQLVSNIEPLLREMENLPYQVSVNPTSPFPMEGQSPIVEIDACTPIQIYRIPGAEPLPLLEADLKQNITAMINPYCKIEAAQIAVMSQAAIALLAIVALGAMTYCFRDAISSSLQNCSQSIALRFRSCCSSRKPSYTRVRPSTPFAGGVEAPRAVELGLGAKSA